MNCNNLISLLRRASEERYDQGYLSDETRAAFDAFDMNATDIESSLAAIERPPRMSEAA